VNRLILFVAKRAHAKARQNISHKTRLFCIVYTCLYTVIFFTSLCVHVRVFIHIVYTAYTQGCAHKCLLLCMNRRACVYVLTYILYTYTHQLVCACAYVCVCTLPFQTGLRLIPIQTSSYKSLHCETTHPTHLRPTVQVPYSKLTC